MRRLQNYYPNEKVVFDFSDVVLKSTEKSCGQYWEDSLKYFNTIPYETITYGDNIISKYGSFKQNISFLVWKFANKFVKNNLSAKSIKFQERLYYYLSKFGIYYLNNGYSKFQISGAKNKFIYGTYEDIRWFDDIREKLLIEFTPKAPVLDTNIELYNKIISSNSICISLRRWDLDVQNNTGLKARKICDENYYSQAINYMKSKVDNPVFVVFSDDVEWGKNIVKKAAGNETIISESGQDNVAEKLRLMYSCKHFILANSTFCWWAQYLCKNDSKIVVSPNCWLKIKNYSHPLISNEWVLLKT
ncbi:alpha-1,2-fucosyltransferase [Clostridium ljungdahlii]|nr:alpha-1,2-fucosyltransferase [Clostridium ljungdahlii]